MKTKLVIISTLLALAFYAAYILNTTGFFRTIHPHFDGTIVAQIDLAGAEDMMVSEADSFLLISATDRAAQRQGDTLQGGIYFMDLSVDNFKIKSISSHFDQPFFPHGFDMIRLDTQRQRLFVVNHVGKKNTVEVFDLYHRDSLVYLKTLHNSAMLSPNDIVATGENQFYFTNDKHDTTALGTIKANYLGVAACEVIYFDGENYRVAADGLAYANGINYDKKRKLMYVASARGFLVKVYKIAKNGDLTEEAIIDCGTGVDNIELDGGGNLWVGGHPSLLAYQSYSLGKKDIAPAEILKIKYLNKTDFTVETVFLDDGAKVSGTSSAAVFGKLIFTGNVMDDHFLVLKSN